MLIIIYIFIANKNIFEKYSVCENIPLGPYITSCSNINYNDDILTAYCVDKNNIKNLSSLDLTDCSSSDCNSIRNDFGTLKC